MRRIPRRLAGLAAATALVLSPLVVQTATASPIPSSTPSPSSGSARTAAATQTLGMDVSSHQGNVNWASWWSQGRKFAYVKAT